MDPRKSGKELMKVIARFAVLFLLAAIVTAGCKKKTGNNGGQ